MAKPKRHRFIVEITDMGAGLTAKQMKNAIKDSINRSMDFVAPSGYYANLQVKEFNRVMVAEQRKSQ